MTDNNKKSGKKDNIHKGHRQRMLDKYTKNGIYSFEEHEILEILLYLAYPQIDVNEKAHRLLKKFGSLDNILNASVEELVKEPDKSTDENKLDKTKDDSLTLRAATILTLVRNVDNYVKFKNAQTENKRFVFSNTTATGEFCCKYFGYNTTEVLNMIVVDGNRRLVCIENISTGNVRQAYANTEKILMTAIRHKACGAILCHNHPGGNLNVSNADSAATNNIGGLLAGIGVKLIDHIICCEDKYESMAQRNMLFY